MNKLERLYHRAEVARGNVKALELFLSEAARAPMLACPRAIRRATANLPKYRSELAGILAKIDRASVNR